jgi:hypothetical protein
MAAISVRAPLAPTVSIDQTVLQLHGAREMREAQ